MARIKVIQHDESDGRLKEIYDDLVQSRGKLADVHMIQSLRPESIVKHMDLYMELMYSKSELSRAEREMIAVVVSGSNECEYCQTHHAIALNHYWKDDQKVELLKEDYREASLEEKHIRLCAYSEHLTQLPGAAKEVDYTRGLKEIGFSDAAVLDATLIVAYFNFVNRIVLSLGVDLEEQADGFKY